jgi:hypothetical protein
MMLTKAQLLLALLLAGAPALSADVALLLEEPYGNFGALNPTGHAALYLSGVCTDNYISLRHCQPGEIGVVISRYHRIGGYDWIAIPAVPYFFAVDNPADVPATVDAQTVERLRDAYRRRCLRALAPDSPDGRAPDGDWTQLIGSAYDRTTYVFELDTAPGDDERVMRMLNSRPNKTRFHLIFRNCADFVRGVVNAYYPGAVRRNFLADAGIMTPKQVARRLVGYGRRHSDLALRSFVIPQVPGLARSKSVRGVCEAFVRSKKYVVFLAYFQPWVAASVAVAYVTGGRFNPVKTAGKVRVQPPAWALAPLERYGSASAFGTRLRH